MKEAIKFIDAVIEERLSDLHTCMPCKVVKYDESEGIADIVPLFKRKFKDKPPEPYPLITNVPVMKRKIKTGAVEVDEPFYEKDDIVLVIFAERALDYVLEGKMADPKYKRKHDLTDAIIIGLLR